AYFGQLNAGKQSIALDLKSPEAIRIVHRMVESADVLVENFRPGVMERLGLGYEALRKINPRLIYCSLSGYRRICRKSRPGLRERLGRGYEALPKINPRLIYCSISGYGQIGAQSERPAYAMIVH